MYLLQPLLNVESGTVFYRRHIRLPKRMTAIRACVFKWTLDLGMRFFYTVMPMKKICIILSLLSWSCFAAAEIVNKSYSTEISYLGSNMPSEFKLGQEVNISFSFDDSLWGVNLLEYPAAVSSFDLTVSAAGFDFASSETQSLFYDYKTDKFSIDVLGNGFEFDGKELVGITLTFSNVDSVEVPLQPISVFKDYALESFYLSFYDESTNTMTTGSLSISNSGKEFVFDLNSSEAFNISDVYSFSNFIIDFDEFDEYSYVKFTYKDGNFVTENWEFEFDSSSSDGISWVTVPVPEPSVYAALFGALALGFALYRRRK